VERVDRANGTPEYEDWGITTMLPLAGRVEAMPYEPRLQTAI
jgi:hypothetical protein